MPQVAIFLAGKRDGLLCHFWVDWGHRGVLRRCFAKWSLILALTLCSFQYLELSSQGIISFFAIAECIYDNDWAWLQGIGQSCHSPPRLLLFPFALSDNTQQSLYEGNSSAASVPPLESCQLSPFPRRQQRIGQQKIHRQSSTQIISLHHCELWTTLGE